METRRLSLALKVKDNNMMSIKTEFANMLEHEQSV